jgi:diguanylate cyclase (GGDEF)-like protein
VGGILLAAIAAAAWAPGLPEGYEGLPVAAPYAVLGTALGVALWFNRGRSFVLLASLLLGWAVYHSLPGKPMFVLVTLLVPLNALIAFFARERGARYGMAFRWLVLFAAEVLVVIWVDSASLPGQDPAHWALRSPPVPLVGRLMFAAGFAAAVWRAYLEPRPLQIANAAALVSFFIGAYWAKPGDPGVFAAFLTAAGVMLLVGLLQESHRLAFRDELTGLPGRRALDERLRTLGEQYAIAMVDVDHFKKFNDTHGHDIGDQVLRLVAGRLAQIGGEGIAYRYGGEEFCVLFPDSDLRRATRHLESMRASIERYKMAVRGPDRPRNPDDTASLRVNKPVEKSLSVTVSIGVAQPADALRTPAQVLKAADEALYRAKQAGRNRVSK